MLINKDNHSSNSSKYHRHSLRIKNYNYSIPGAYFITICTYLKENLLGYISEGKIELKVLGKITAREWLKTFQIRKNIQLDEYVIMPNHFHGIINLIENNGHNSLCPYINNQNIYNCRGTMHRALDKRKTIKQEGHHSWCPYKNNKINVNCRGVLQYAL